MENPYVGRALDSLARAHAHSGAYGDRQSQNAVAESQLALAHEACTSNMLALLQHYDTSGATPAVRSALAEKIAARLGVSA